MNNKKLFLVILFVILANSSFASEAPIEYDRGTKKDPRNYQSAENCSYHPCIITQWGAIRFSDDVIKDRHLEIGVLHRGAVVPISLFQESTTLEQKLSERIFNRKPNRNVINLPRLVELGKTDTIYVYGLLLQYEFDEGDLIVIKVTSLKDSREMEEYYFRYHNSNIKWDVDIAFVQPINFFNPNPGDVIQAAYSTSALSFSFAKPMDPDRYYSLPGRFIRSARFHITAGLLLRRDVTSFGGDNITSDFIDGFGGAGFTFFDFLSFGYGANFVRSPHTSFPYVGIEVRHLFEFLRSLKQDTHSQWEKYLKKETERSRQTPPE